MTQNTNASGIEELGRAWAPEANWRIPDTDTVFVFPAFGPNNYGAVVKQVLASGQRLPTGEQSALMLKEAYNSAEIEVKQSPRTRFVREEIMNYNWLLVPQVNVWTQRGARNPGMYSVFDKNGEGLDRVWGFPELEDILSGGSTERGVRFSQDMRVAFAPLNTINPGYHEKGKLAQDGAFIATYGVKGAEGLDQISKTGIKSYSWIIKNDSDKPIQTHPRLNRIFLSLGVPGQVGRRISASFNYKDIGSRGSGYILSVRTPSA